MQVKGKYPNAEQSLQGQQCWWVAPAQDLPPYWPPSDSLPPQVPTQTVGSVCKSVLLLRAWVFYLIHQASDPARFLKGILPDPEHKSGSLFTQLQSTVVPNPRGFDSIHNYMVTRGIIWIMCTRFCTPWQINSIFFSMPITSPGISSICYIGRHIGSVGFVVFPSQ